MTPTPGTRAAQRGGTLIGVIIGLLAGLGIALGVALYIAKVPVPFVDKVGHRSNEQSAAEAEKLKNWDPNAGLAGKPAPRPAPPASEPAAATAPPAQAPAPVASAPAPAKAASRAAAAPVAVASAPAAAAPAPAAATPPKSTRDPAAILAGQDPRGTEAKAAPAAEGFVYFVQAGAYSNGNDAEQQRAKLAMLGVTAKVTEREQSGRTVYRVRLGPFEQRSEAEQQQEQLKAAGAEAALIRVERSKL